MNKLIKESGVDKLCFVWYTNNNSIRGGVFNNIDKRLINFDTQFRIASVTKPMTALMICIIIEANLLKFTDTVYNLAPGLEKLNHKITIINLLSHTSGLPTMPTKYDRKKDAKHYNSMLSVVKTFIDEPFEYMMIGKFQYSNLGYLILGYIIEHITKQSWLKNMTKYIFKPLNMINTGVGLQTDLYSIENGKVEKILNLGDKDQLWWASSCGGLHSTINDIIKFGTGYKSLIKDKNIIKIYENKCWFQGKKLIQHDGGIQGGAAQLNIYNDGTIYVFLTNVNHTKPLLAFSD